MGKQKGKLKIIKIQNNEKDQTILHNPSIRDINRRQLTGG